MDAIPRKCAQRRHQRIYKLFKRQKLVKSSLFERTYCRAQTISENYGENSFAADFDSTGLLHRGASRILQTCNNITEQSFQRGKSKCSFFFKSYMYI